MAGNRQEENLEALVSSIERGLGDLNWNDLLVRYLCLRLSNQLPANALPAEALAQRATTKLFVLSFETAYQCYMGYLLASLLPEGHDAKVRILESIFTSSNPERDEVERFLILSTERVAFNYRTPVGESTTMQAPLESQTFASDKPTREAAVFANSLAGAFERLQYALRKPVDRITPFDRAVRALSIVEGRQAIGPDFFSRGPRF